MIRHRILVALFMAVVALPLSSALEACSTVPIVGRKQVILMPKGRESAMGAQSYTEILSEEKVSSNKGWSDIVKRVGQRVAKVTGEKSYDWQYKLIASDMVNAFCLPGGKVAFYEGIMPVCANEAGVAVVMGHEIGHAIARHGVSRMRQNILVQMGAIGIDIATRDKGEQKRLVLLGAYGAAANLGFVLPFSRKHETEADHIGLMYMAMAGYDPAEAPRFWQRMAKEGGGGGPGFLSTHPKSEKRAADLNALLGEAKKLYKQSKTKHGLGASINGGASKSAPPKRSSAPAQKEMPPKKKAPPKK